MPQTSMYIAGVAAGAGATGLLLAWDRYDRGPGAADDLDTGGMGLYTLMGLTTGANLVRMKTMNPIPIPEEQCPDAPDGFGVDGTQRDLVARVSAKPGGTALGSFADVTLDLFEASTKVYGAAAEGETLKVELADNSLVPAEVSFQDRLIVQAWEDPLEGWAALMGHQAAAKDIWVALMTPAQPLEWF